MFFDTSTLFHAFYCNAPAAWIKVLSVGVCFKSLASFCHPQYLLRTSPRSIPCAWNSRIWHFHLNNALLPPKKCLKSRFCDFEAWIDEIECQFRRFLARTFRPVDISRLLTWLLSFKVRSHGHGVPVPILSGEPPSSWFCILSGCAVHVLLRCMLRQPRRVRWLIANGVRERVCTAVRLRVCLVGARWQWQREGGGAAGTHWRCVSVTRHLGSSTAANWVSFDLNVSCSSCWGYSLINTLKLTKKKLETNAKEGVVGPL